MQNKRVSYEVSDDQGIFGCFDNLEDACTKARYLSTYSSGVSITRVSRDTVDLTFINGELK